MTLPPADVLTLPPEADAIARATQWLDELAVHHQWSSKLKFALTLSVDETLTNILMHGFTGASDAAEQARYIRLEHTQREQTVEITVADNGRAFDPTSIPPPDAAASVEAAKIGGHGVQLMRHYLKQLSYSRVNGENRLHLVAEGAAR